ncbi:MAG: ABC transporter substrate-binding protein [Oscillospiraceae bacterium]
MKEFKHILAATAALTLAFSITACSDKKQDTSSSYVDKVTVDITKASDIANIQDGAKKEITYLGEADLNPTDAAQEKSTELTLFESKGGKILYKPTTHDARFDDLATHTLSGDIDIFKYEWLAYPSQIVKDIYQPIDELADFDSSLWSGVKTTAEQFALGGKHYVAPLTFEASAYIFYDKDTLTANGLDDPQNLWVENKWTWDTFESMMKTYIGNATGDEIRYGINGFFKPHLVQQTGKTMVSYDQATNQFANNIGDPNIERAENLLYEMSKSELILNGWYGSAQECFDANCLFYAMGSWAATGDFGPKDDDEWGVVPMPKDPNHTDLNITTSNMTAYMWVKGSTAKEAVKTWYECCRVSATSQDYKQTNQDKFFASNPNWTQNDYDIFQSILGDDYTMLTDYGYGISAALGDPKQFDGNQCLIDALYGDVTVIQDDGSQDTWTKVRDTYSSVVDSSVSQLNTELKAYGGNK